MNIILIILALCLTSCNAKNFYCDTYAPENELTLGVVQKEIYEGVSQDQVAMALGSPNIVTRDKDAQEVWIYDKIATEVRASGTSGVFLFCQTGADYVNRRDLHQKSLTVVLKFDENRQVNSISYHSSKF